MRLAHAYVSAGAVDIALTVAGMVIALTVWPPAKMLAILVALVGIVIPRQLRTPRG